MVAQFIAEDGVLKGLILPLENGEEWTLGRDPDSCQIVIEDPKASRQHAICKNTDDGIIIENLSQTNPVLVNQTPVSTPRLLQEGDLVRIGSTTFRFTLKPPVWGEGPQRTTFPPLHESFADRSESPYETVFQDVHDTLTPPMDLKIRERWLLKIIAGPQSGAEFSMETGKSYIIGNDPSSCDIIFYDLSVSRQHARLATSPDGSCTIEDLESRNGTIVDGKPIGKKTLLKSQDIISLGTTSFVVIDREKASETLFALPLPQEPSPPEEKEKLPPIEETVEPPVLTDAEIQAAALASEKEAAQEKAHAHERKVITSGGLIIAFTILGVLALVAIGTWKLFNTKEAYVEHIDYAAEINKALEPFPSVSYTFNKATGTLFLVGHVLTPVDKNQLLYNLQGLGFITHIDDVNVVIDQLVWQEMNNLIAKNPIWNGVNMYATAPGHFVITGYLKTTQQAGQLTDYINRNFPYLDMLENRVVVEQDLIGRVQADLLAQGFNGVNVQIVNGELTLTGFIPGNQATAYQNLIKTWKTVPGIRVIKTFVASLAPEAAIINLSDRYKVTGYAKSDAVNVNVIINGRILTRGDTLDGMTITSIQPDTIYLEKDGLKFKINYNP